jgi:hypothetical protein
MKPDPIESARNAKGRYDLCLEGASFSLIAREESRALPGTGSSSSSEAAAAETTETTAA